ncbi:sulfite exporter TauE/SafE family protein [Streptomyces sp. SID3343]|uniref:sulfite exporter TauE/SafE family protein n=1 Tax=Streptomyces sp. SID3343 TaxID=2690260 RepID=UPI00136810CC|nr:sulfite exporter TauE/SafE family protein [Streptomyces sp. SID3343]MYW03515.1 TSUP family transporter [Streptomyces sp. SID3343]
MTGVWSVALLLGGIVLLGASVQRLTGMGFALVAAPGLVLLLGPAQGVVLSNCGSGAISAIGLAVTWRQVRLKAMLPLVAAAACTVPLGTWVASRLPEPWLLVGVGTLVCVAVLFVMRGVRVPALRARRGAVAAGAASGFMNSSAGVGGPAVSLFAVNAGWTAAEFVPNGQFYAFVVNAFSVATKSPPHLSTPAWTMIGVALVAGAVIGQYLAKHTSEHQAKRTVLWLALAGGAVTLAKGVWTI